MRDLGTRAFHSQSPDYRIGRAEDPGVALDTWLQRVALAWALQAPALLGPLKPDARVDWKLSPGSRLGRLAPFAQWGEPSARLLDGELLWIVDGYLPAGAFPLSSSIEWRGHRVTGFRAGLLGTVSAQTGATRIYLRPGADALASAWAAIAAGVVEPSSAIPEAVWRAAPYPADLFRVQARQLERSSLKPGSLGIRSGETTELPRVEAGWSDDTTGPVLAVAFERPGERRLSALLTGSHADDADELRLARFDSATALPSRSALESRWARFPSYDALSDSIRDEGGRLERGPVRFDLEPGGLVAYQSHFASSAGGRPALVWVTVRDRRPAGRGTLAQGSLEQPARSDRAGDRGSGAGDPAGRGATAAAARRLRAPRRGLGRLRSRLVRAAATHSVSPRIRRRRELARPWGRDYLRGLFPGVERVKTAVLALGGNALAQAGEPATITNQFRHARESMAPIVELARAGWQIVLVHGNGPQVGDELVRNEAARRLVEPLPLGVLVAETAGWIGYMLQQSLQNALAAARRAARRGRR